MAGITITGENVLAHNVGLSQKVGRKCTSACPRGFSKAKMTFGRNLPCPKVSFPCPKMSLGHFFPVLGHFFPVLGHFFPVLGQDKDIFEIGPREKVSLGFFTLS